MESLELIPYKKVEMSYGRTGEASIIFCKCDFTGEETYCIGVDCSNGEYGPLSISIKFINESLEKFMQRG